MVEGMDNKAYQGNKEDWYRGPDSPAVETYKKAGWRERYKTGLKSIIPIRSKR